MKQMGLFGGSFNPIHNGHLHLVCAVQDALKLDGVLLMPTGEAPHKSSALYASAEDRLAMCRLAAEPYPWLAVSAYETRRAGKSYTVETLRYLTAQYPEAEWTLMIGSDMLLSFDTWRCWQEIAQMARICAVSRHDGDNAALQAYAETLMQQAEHAEITVLPVGALELSSTEIREKLQNREDTSCLLPENVVQYICANGLYRK